MGIPLNSKSKRILIVEDDEHINAILHDGLTAAGFQCTRAYSGSEGMLNLAEQEYHLIVLDLMLPGLSGEAFMQRLREEPEVPDSGYCPLGKGSAGS